MTVAMSVADVLERAADLIEPQGKWTQGTFARGKRNRPCKEGNSSTARCWCALGAIQHETNSVALRNEAHWRLRKTLGMLVTSFNDAPGRTQAEVVAALREAAALAREQQT